MMFHYEFISFAQLYLVSAPSGANSHPSLISPALLLAAALRPGADIIWMLQSRREMEG